MRTRTNSFLCSLQAGKMTTNDVVTNPTFSFVSSGNSITDELHAWPPPKQWGLKDVGGTLDMVKYMYSDTGTQVDAAYRLYTGRWNRYKGPVFSGYPSMPWGAFTFHGYKSPAVSDAVLFAKGGTAIARCAPTNPHASLSQALIEIRRDGIPAVPGLLSFQKGARPVIRKFRKGKMSFGKKVPVPWQLAGSEYLNVEFGWKPLLSDIRKVAQAHVKSSDLARDYVNNSGRLVRRTYEFPAETAYFADTVSNAYGGPTLPSGCTVTSGTTTRTGVVTTTIRFSGAFTYHVSESDSKIGQLLRAAQVANHLTGGGINPAVVWDVLPYSWAVDWLSNTGDVIKNASAMATDGLVVVYGYIVARTETVTVFTTRGMVVRTESGATKSVPPFSQTFTQVRVQRRRATPFGFGLNVTQFSARQLAIVAALGLSRDGRKLAL